MRNHWLSWIAGGVVSGAVVMGAAGPLIFVLSTFVDGAPLSADDAQFLPWIGGFTGIYGAIGGGVTGIVSAIATIRCRSNPNGTRRYRVTACATAGILALGTGLAASLPPLVGGEEWARWTDVLHYAVLPAATAATAAVASWFIGGWIWRWTHPADHSAARSSSMSGRSAPIVVESP